MGHRQNVVRVALDSVRQDRTAIGGYDRDSTPCLQSPAARDAEFDDAMRKQLSDLGYVE
jgi:hypothetical protein